jgi:hypothetical protein
MDAVNSDVSHFPQEAGSGGIIIIIITHMCITTVRALHSQQAYPL